MGQRIAKTSKKLALNKETLRRLQLRTLSDDQLQVAVGGWNTGRCVTDCCVPSHGGC